MKYIQHFCFILILVIQFGIAQIALATTSIPSTTQFNLEQSNIQMDIADKQDVSLEQECLDEHQQTSCISHCSTLAFIPTLTLELIDLSHTSEQISCRFWASQTAEPTPILFPPIS